MILSRPLASLCFVNRFTLYRSLSIFSHSWNLNVNLFISSAFELINCDQYTSCNYFYFVFVSLSHHLKSAERKMKRERERGR